MPTLNTYTGIGNEVYGWYSKRLLRHAIPQIVLENFAQLKELPQNQTDSMQFRRPNAYTPATVPLSEGVQPRGSSFSYDSITVILQQYGDFSEITDKVDVMSKNAVFRDMGMMQGEQAGATRELLTWDVVRSGTNISYGGGVTTRATVTKTSIMSAAKHRSIIADLQRQKAQKFTRMLKGSENYETFTVAASYIAVGHTDVVPVLRDLKGENANSHFTPVEQYGSSMGLVSMYEQGTFEAARFVCTADLDPFYGEGATTASGDTSSWRNTDVSGTKKYDVYPLVYIGRDSYGAMVLRGKRAVIPMILPPGIPRSSDRLGQTGSVGWKFWFGATILNESWMERLEIAVPQ